MKLIVLCALLCGVVVSGGAQGVQRDVPPSAPSRTPARPVRPIVLPNVLPRTHAPQPTRGAIRAEDLETRLYIFADDSMGGRETGTHGNVKGTAYLAAEAKRIGLQPAGENGTYFQVLPLTEEAVRPGTQMIAGRDTLGFKTEFVPGRRAFGGILDVVYGGRLDDEASMLTSEQMAGKAVVFTMPDSGFWGRSTRDSTAAAIIFVNRQMLTPANVAMLLRPFVMPTAAIVEDSVKARPSRAAAPVVYVSPAGAAKLFSAPLATLAPGAAGKPLQLQIIVTRQPAPEPARNVVAMIPGSDPALRGQYVALGAHNDHIGAGTSGGADHDSVHVTGLVAGRSRPTAEQQAIIDTTLALLRARHPIRRDSIGNGADDDGSGSVTLLEIGEYLQSRRVKPKRTILLVWHTGEEKGLWGSDYFTTHPTVPRDSIVAQLNLDMVGRGSAADTPEGGPDFVLAVGARRLSTQLGDLLEATNTARTHPLRLDYSWDAPGHSENIYCRSDHYNYARFGIPIIFFTTGLHADYHRVTDEPQYIDYAHMARIASLVADVATRIADRPQRLVVDKPLLDPKGACQQ